LTVTTIALPQNEPEDTTVVQRDEQITPEEEREARELAALLTRRWRETEDIAPLINEFFVSDFADRLRHEPELFLFTELKEEQLTPEDRDDLLRHYIAMSNFLHLMVRVYEVHWPLAKSAKEGEEPDLEKMLPANVLDVIKSDPTLSAIYAEETGEKAEAPNQSEETSAEERSVNTIERLRGLTNALERAVALLRDYVKTLPSSLTASELMMMKEQESDKDSESAENDDPLRPHLHILSEDFYGYSSGTRLICINILPFHLDLVRAGQNLKVVSIYIQGD
ncbi:MAG: hypothetical protein H0X14_09875, partial [Acidobacteria bacterium]|nr:hypothetical protein [Acidobacteriota bacterium]